MQNMLIWLHKQILMTRQLFYLLIKTHRSKMTICKVRIHSLFASKLDWHLPNPRGICQCWIPEKKAKKNALALFLSFACSDLSE